MTRVVGEVAIEVGADIGPLTREMGKASSAVNSFGATSRRLGANMQNFGRSAMQVGKQMSIVSGAIAAGAAAAFALASSTARAGDEIAKSARQAGVSGEYFQEMAFAIGQVTNLTQDQLTTALTMLNRKLGEAQNGSASAIRAFDAIGISAEDLASGAVTTEQAFDALVKTMGETRDPAIAAAISTSLLGRSGAALGGQLAGAEGAVDGLRARARELGIVMSGEALKASEDFNDKMDELRRSFEALRVQIGAKLLPVFVNRIIPAIQDKVIPAFQKIVEQIGNAIDWFAALPAPVQEAAGAMVLAFGVAGPVVAALGATIFAIGSVVAMLGAAGPFVAAVAAATVSWVVFGKRFNEILDSTFGQAPPAIKLLIHPLGALADTIETLTENWEKLGAMVQWVIDKFEDAREVLRTLGSFGGAAAGPGITPGMSVQDQFTGPAAAMRGMGGDLVDGTLRGIGAGIDAQEQNFRNEFDRIPEIARDQFEIHSPSRVFHDIGTDIGQGLAEGIISTQALVAEATAAIGNTAAMTAGEFASSILGSMKTMFEGSKPIAAAQALVNTYLGITEALKLPFPANLAAAAKVAAQGFAAVRGIRGASMGGGGGGGRAAASGGGAAAPAQGGTYLNFTFPSGMVSSEQMGRWMVETLNRAVENGSVIKGARVA